MRESRTLSYSSARHMRTFPFSKYPNIEVSVSASDGEVVDIGMPRGRMNRGSHFQCWPWTIAFHSYPVLVGFIGLHSGGVGGLSSVFSTAGS
jgi:hypothetical protein